MSNDKYKMFKNFMFNELGITKEDIRTWVIEVVRDEARKVVQHTYDNFDIEKCLRDQITASYSPIRRDIVSSVSQSLLEKFDIKIEERK